MQPDALSLLRTAVRGQSADLTSVLDVLERPQSTIWCPGEDSNLHGFHHWYLKPARLPIPPPGQRGLLTGRATGAVNALPAPSLSRRGNRAWPGGRHPGPPGGGTWPTPGTTTRRPSRRSFTAAGAASGDRRHPGGRFGRGIVLQGGRGVLLADDQQGRRADVVVLVAHRLAVDHLVGERGGLARSGSYSALWATRRRHSTKGSSAAAGRTGRRLRRKAR